MKKLQANAYGHFSPDGREYVITRPDTPKPWVNVICPGNYGTVISQGGSGYSWTTHAQHNRLNRWEQDLVKDEWGKFLYCRDRDSEKFWSLGWQPVKAEPTSYEVRHGIGYTVIDSVNDGIESEYTIFVPEGETNEVWYVQLTNHSKRTRKLDVFTYLEWNLGPSPDTHREFHKLFIETEVVKPAHTMLATKRLNTIAEHGRGTSWNVEWPHVAFLSSSVEPVSWESDKDRFLGQYGSLAAPAAMKAKKLSNLTGKWQDGIGALQVAVSLKPGETKELIFTLGQAETRTEALKAAKRYRTGKQVMTAFRRTQKFWDALMSPLEVKTPDAAFDVLTNTWLKYQSISCRLWGRTAYYQTGGAYGFRDQLQDSQVFLPLAPAHTRRQIRLHAAHQFTDGTAYHWWHPLTEEGLKKPLNDDLLWLPFVTLNYIRETGDYSVLADDVPFLIEPKKYTKESYSIEEHCRRAIDSFWTRLSPRGVPRMGAGDWNDGLSAIGAKGKSESVWLAHFLIGILDGWCEMEARRAKPDQALIKRYTTAAAKMRKAVNTHFWDGEWYQRATKDSGEVIGSRKNVDGRIYLNAQTWAILHDVAPKARVPKLLKSLKKHLYKPYGPLLLAPAYRTVDETIGYLTRYSPGSRENGGLYTHAGVWAIQAECKLGREAQAWELYKSFCPVYRGQDPDFYVAEPYVTPGNVDGPDSPFNGRGGWTWYTGSASWLFRISTEWILGVRPTFDGLLIQPCLPPHWKGFTMKRVFRGATYQITVKRGGTRGVVVDGKAIRGWTIAPHADGQEHLVVVRL